MSSRKDFEMTECEKCGGTNIKMTVSIMIKMDAKYESRITKKVLAEKGTEIIAANWDRVIYYCSDCGYTEKYNY